MYAEHMIACMALQVKIRLFRLINVAKLTN